MSLWGLVFVSGHEQLSLLIMGGGTANYRLFNYLSDFPES